MKKLSRKKLAQITGSESGLPPEGGTNNGGTTGNIVCGKETKCCSQQQMIETPECCVCVENLG